MTIQLHFRLMFESDWHISAGHGIGLQADSAIQRDPDGIPIITGSTLKGLFRDALYELRHHSALRDALPNTILGGPAAESVWLFGAARPVDDAQLPRLEPGIDLAHVTTGVRVHPATRSAERSKLYQQEMGSQALEFVFTIEGNWTNDTLSEQEAVEWLIAAARYIRRLGARRRRGAGRCRITLENARLQTEILNAFGARLRDRETSTVNLPRRQFAYDAQADSHETARRFRFILRTDSPLVVAQKPESGNVFESQARIPGQTVRGALAERVGPNRLNAADYATFLDLFVLGGIQFNDLLLLELDHTRQAGAVVSALPLGLMKNEEGNIISVLTNDSSTFEGYRNTQGYAYLQDDWHNTVHKNAIQHVTRMHVQIDSSTKRAADRNLYAYDAVPRGQYFVGEIVLRDDVQWSVSADFLRANLRQPFQINLGKGRRRGYGACTAWIEPLNSNTPSLWSQIPLATRLNLWSQQLLITLTTDTILIDHWGRAIQSFDHKWLASVLGIATDEFTIRDSVARSKVIEGFDTLSGLPRWRDIGLQAGSSVMLNVTFDPSSLLSRLANLEQKGIGLRCNEGFGRIVFNHPFHTMQQAGFVPPISIDDSLIRIRPDASDTRAEFVSTWQAHLDTNLKLRHFMEGDRLASQYRTLARRLVEQRPADLNAAQRLFRSLGEPPAAGQTPYRLSQSYLDNRQKENRFDKAAIGHVISLLAYLDQTYPTHWQRGVVMLAEALLNLEKKEAYQL